MNKNIKRISACLIFCIILCLLIGQVNNVLISKKYNRYYFMDYVLREENSKYDVQVFGACHSYTSFNAKYFEETYGATSYVLGNAGEIMPATYLRMMERFKTDAPKVALVEIWGLNPYDTYTRQGEIFESYMPINVELLPFSLEKLEVINDFYSLDMLLENFPMAKYKDRIINEELGKLDFYYSYDELAKVTSNYTREEMAMRLENNGFCEMPMWLDSSEVSYSYTPYMDVSDYHEKQPDVGNDETLEIEADIMKYVDKTIELCEKYDVELIFYRAPYVSKENELKKANWFSQYCNQKGVLFYDLEKEVSFDLSTDFLDYHHLNKFGAQKATDYLAKEILPLISSKTKQH